MCGAPGAPVAVMNLECSGNELDISGCSWSPTSSTCNAHEEDVIMFCTLTSAKSVYDEGSLRLLSDDGAPSVDGSGVLEMFHAGSWGSVCAEGFAPGSADVACKQMGFSGGNAKASSSHCSGDGCVPPHVSDVACSGHESGITACPFSEGDDVFCAASEALYLACAGTGDASGRPAKQVAPSAV